jgi:hypothetical protein
MFLIVCKCLRRLRCLHAAVFSVAVFSVAGTRRLTLIVLTQTMTRAPPTTTCVNY